MEWNSDVHKKGSFGSGGRKSWSDGGARGNSNAWRYDCGKKCLYMTNWQFHSNSFPKKKSTGRTLILDIFCFFAFLLCETNAFAYIIFVLLSSFFCEVFWFSHVFIFLVVKRHTMWTCFFEKKHRKQKMLEEKKSKLEGGKWMCFLFIQQIMEIQFSARRQKQWFVFLLFVQSPDRRSNWTYDEKSQYLQQKNVHILKFFCWNWDRKKCSSMNRELETCERKNKDIRDCVRTLYIL